MSPRYPKTRRRQGEPQIELLILSRDPRLYSTKRLLAEARRGGLRAALADPYRLIEYYGDPQGGALGGLENIGLPRVVLARIAYSAAVAGLAALRQLELLGVQAVNSAAAVAMAHDKPRTLLELTRAGLPVPPSTVLHRPGDLRLALRHVGGLPAVIKTPRGTHGIGVVKATTPEEALDLVSLALRTGDSVIVQKYIAAEPPGDLRVIVAGGKACAAMRRAGRKDFRANLHRGGRAESWALGPRERNLAEHAAAALGLGVAGVDIIAGPAGLLVLEVNSSPGLEGIEEAAAINVAGAIIAYARKLIRSR